MGVGEAQLGATCVELFTIRRTGSAGRLAERPEGALGHLASRSGGRWGATYSAVLRHLGPSVTLASIILGFLSLSSQAYLCSLWACLGNARPKGPRGWPALGPTGAHGQLQIPSSPP